MSGDSYILAIDQGTTSTSALLFNKEGKPVAAVSRELPQIFPKPGWVEHDPRQIYETSLGVAADVMAKNGISAGQVRGIGITNQRETTVVWDRATGEPVYNAVVWQCRRTAELCEELKDRGLEQTVREKTGLPIDAYFSGTKLRWILDNIPRGQERAENGELLFGTVDTWLVWNLTGGKAHITDFSNASRTMLYNIYSREWDPDLLRMLDIPAAVLPEVVPTSHIYGETGEGLLGDARIPLGSVVGDQQAALFGQACYETGMAKNTYGTGSFVLFNTGVQPVASEGKLITTLAWGMDSEVKYALEGSIFVTGSAVQWLRDGLGIIKTAAESEPLARSVPDNGGVYFVPALTGLGAPYWDMYARGTISGITRGTTKGHIARATLEAIVCQARDVIEAMQSEAGITLPVLRVDGGGTANGLLMQLQADILGVPIQKAAVAETTALGAAYLAGLAVGMWKDTSEIAGKWSAVDTFEPAMSEDERDTLYQGWKKAVATARGTAPD